MGEAEYRALAVGRYAKRLAGDLPQKFESLKENQLLFVAVLIVTVILGFVVVGLLLMALGA